MTARSEKTSAPLCEHRGRLRALRPACRHGYQLSNDPRYQGKSWTEVPSRGPVAIKEPTRFVVPVVEERVQVDREFEAPEQAGCQGARLVVPMMEEVVVAETRRIVTEEIHTRNDLVSAPHDQTVTLRRERAEVERTEPP